MNKGTICSFVMLTILLGLSDFSASQDKGAEKKSVEVPMSERIFGLTLTSLDDVEASLSVIKTLQTKPSVRVVFDLDQSFNQAANKLERLHREAFIMAQLADSSALKKLSIQEYQDRLKKMSKLFQPHVDVWEIANEVNGNWVGQNAMKKTLAAFQLAESQKLKTAVTFFYQGIKTDKLNCLEKNEPDVFQWIQSQFQLDRPVEKRDSEIEKMRLNLDYVFMSWYPKECRNLQVDWKMVFVKMQSVFPNSKLGFGELGTAEPEFGSDYEFKLMDHFYKMKANEILPQFVGGYFWWYFGEEIQGKNKNRFIRKLQELSSVRN